MTFGFHILGLFIVYLVICVYFFRYNKNKSNMFYKILLFLNFISQILYLLSFIFLSRNDNSAVIVVKSFLSSIIVWISMLFGYIFSKYLSVNYSYKESIISKYSNLLLLMLSIISIMFVGLIIVSSLNIDGYTILGLGVNYTYSYSMFFVVFSLLFMIFNVFKMDKSFYLKLYIPIGIALFTLILQSISDNISIMASGYTMIVLYLYLILENNEVELIRDLEVAKRSALVDSEEKSKFLERISREIRGPINTIEGFSQIIVNEDNVDTIKNDVKDIISASNNLVDMVNGIMDISMIESGKMEINERDYETKEMLDGVSAIYKGLGNKKDIEFKVSYGDNIPSILNGDSEKIKRVLVNLLNNAFKYTDKGYVEFSVNSVNNGNMCRLIISVSDTGRGIDKSEINNIFHKYESINKKDSNGLGLAVASNLVSLMGGKIDVDSELGKGSKFTVTIDQKVISNESVKLEVENVGKIKMFDATGMRVLVVDDNKLNLKVAKRLLEEYKIEVLCLNSGDEFLDLIEEDNKFDLILMDDMMPKMSGTEALDLFKKIERVDGYYIPVVVLTANAISGMKDKYLELGFDDYLAKPTSKYELNRILRKYLKK